MEDTVALTTAAEMETITPVIAAEFGKAGIACGGFTRPRRGGPMMAAQVEADAPTTAAPTAARSEPEDVYDPDGLLYALYLEEKKG